MADQRDHHLTPVLDDEPRDVHPISCAVWSSPDPADECDCGAADFQAGVQQWIDRFDSYTPQHGRAS